MQEAEKLAVDRRVDLILTLVGAIPPAWRKALFTSLFALFYHLSPSHRIITLYNLRRAFPEKADAEIRRIARGAYRNLGIVAAEFFDLPGLNREKVDRDIDVEGLDHCRRALEKGKGVLFFGAHFGNWEMEALAVALLVKPCVVIYRPLDNALLDRLVLKVRGATGNTPLAKERAMRPMLRTLKENGMLGILIDQNVDCYEGIFVDYFGRPACTTDGLALLALHTGAPVLPGHMARQPDGRYRLVLGPEVEVIDTGDRATDIRVNTQRFTKVIEETVRRHPDQWLWLHKRWKTQACQARRAEACEP